MLLNPAILYLATWSFVLVLYALRLSGLLDSLRLATITLVVGTSVAFVLGWALESLPFYGRLAAANVNLAMLRASVTSVQFTRRLKIIWTIFFVGISFEILYFRGLPLLGLLGIGANMGYAEFGIHGFHGLMNALFFAACAMQFARILLGSSRRWLALSLVSFGYPILAMSREVMISMLLQDVFIFFSVRRPSRVVLIRAGFGFAATFLAFGYLGDLRSGRAGIIALGSPSFEYPDWLPSAFIWFYIYLCTPLNNVNYNIDIEPNYFPLDTAGTFIPSFAREWFLNTLGAQRGWELVTDTFNVSSLLQSLLTDFGITGSIIFTLVCGIVFSRVLRRSTDSAPAYFVMIVILHGIALSFFTNMLFNLISLFEVLAVMWAVPKAQR